MMDHEFYIDRLSAFFDGELKHEEEQIVGEHVKDCSECQAILADLKKFDQMVDEHAELGEDAYWEKSANKIEAAIGGEKTTEVVDVKPSAKSIWLSWKTISSLATAAVLIFIAVNYVDISDNMQRQTATSPIPTDDSLTVDKLLDEVAGVVTSTGDSGKGEVFIRGGRAGEVGYIVDGVPKEEKAEKEDTDKIDHIVEKEKLPEPVLNKSVTPTDVEIKSKTKQTAVDKSQAEKLETVQIDDDELKKNKLLPSAAQQKIETHDLSQTISVQAERLVIEESPALDNFVAEDVEQDELRSLDQWRDRADSLNTLLKKDSQIKSAKTISSEKVLSTPDLDSAKVLIEDQLIDCYYNIGATTEDKKEYNDAVVKLTEFTKNQNLDISLKATEELKKLLELKRFE